MITALIVFVFSLAIAVLAFKAEEWAGTEAAKAPKMTRKEQLEVAQTMLFYIGILASVVAGGALLFMGILAVVALAMAAGAVYLLKGNEHVRFAASKLVKPAEELLHTVKVFAGNKPETKDSREKALPQNQPLMQASAWRPQSISELQQGGWGEFAKSVVGDFYEKGEKEPEKLPDDFKQQPEEVTWGLFGEIASG